MGEFEPGEERPETGYAMTQLLPRSGQGSLVLGFDRHERFQQTFTFDTRQRPPSLAIQTLWDQKDPAGLVRCESERLAIFEHTGVEGALREWARLAAESATRPPRTGSSQITGWCSWYNLYAAIHEDNLREHLQAAVEVSRQESLPMRVFQIDDGYTPEMGDWLDVKPQFPHGMKALLDEIRQAGFVPGLWIAPFMVGNRSRLYREHPDWVVKDRETGGPLAQMRHYGEFRWHKRSEEYYTLDTTHPEAFDYLRQVFRTWRREWGCEYFKTDFMFYGSEHGPDRLVWHRPGLTRIEVWRRVAEMIRQEIGEALWLGCGCPLWASIGLVDGIRIGRDVGVEWEGNLSAQSLLRDQATRNFANGILWQADPDCVLLRDRFHHLSDGEVRSLAIYAGMSGGVMMTSDHLGELSPERLRLWRLILGGGRSTCRFPFLGQTELWYEKLPPGQASRRVKYQAHPVDPVLVQVRSPLGAGGRAGSGGDEDQHAIFIFNTGEQAVERSYRLADLGLPERMYLFDWISEQAQPEAVRQFSITLPAHDSVLLFVSVSRIDQTPERLPGQS
ncbi:MAG: alpha-galactosidase, partial [Chloroflexota bacterium]